tara:strand:+ start:18389 stop:18748 length:360 start_codon:yes stop_codon:yes gene_type:complete
MSQSNCLFCKIADKEIPADIIYEDDDFICFKDINPKAQVHLLVIPKEHIQNLNDLDQNNKKHHELMSNALMLLPKVAKLQGLDTGFRTMLNTGIGGGQEVYHLHFHILGGEGVKKILKV